MNRGSHTQYEFPPDLPISGVRPGTNILVDGPSSSGAREIALRLVTDVQADDEGMLLVSADVSGRALLERCEAVVPDLDRSRLAVVDCSGAREDGQARFQPHAVRIEDPSALPEIGIELSTLYETLAERGHDRIRMGVFSVSSMLAHANLQAVSRFVHMLTGRVIATRDLGVFLLDADAVDDRSIEVLEHFVDGRIEVRDADGDGYEIREEGLGEESSDWTPVDVRAVE